MGSPFIAPSMNVHRLDQPIGVDALRAAIQPLDYPNRGERPSTHMMIYPRTDMRPVER